MAKASKSLAYVPSEKSLDCCEIPCSPGFPCIYLDSKQMPELEDWKVGEVHKITVSVKLKNLSRPSNSDRFYGDLEVTDYERENKKSLT